MRPDELTIQIVGSLWSKYGFECGNCPVGRYLVACCTLFCEGYAEFFWLRKHPTCWRVPSSSGSPSRSEEAKHRANQVNRFTRGWIAFFPPLLFPPPTLRPSDPDGPKSRSRTIGPHLSGLLTEYGSTAALANSERSTRAASLL